MDFCDVIRDIRHWFSGLWIEVLTKAIENEATQQTDGFLSMLLGTLDASSLRNLLKKLKYLEKE